MSYAHENSKGKTYYLHSRKVTLHGRDRQIHFFANEPGDGALDAVPEGYIVSEGRNGLPVLKKAQQEVAA